jgi:hypothetical protein
VISEHKAHIKQWFGALMTMAALVVSMSRVVKAVPSIQEARGREGDAVSHSGPNEDIKVHGHWTIEVRNPDGSLATHREFENALAFDGPLNLATALGRAATVGLWRLEVDFANYPAGPCIFNSSPIYCLIHESTDTNVPGAPDSNDFFSLTVSAPFRPDPNAGTLTLSGTFTVGNAGQIAGVGSALGACAPNVPPASCTLGPAFNSYQVLGYSAFSATAVAPIAVTVGQLVQVTVVFSFS